MGLSFRLLHLTIARFAYILFFLLVFILHSSPLLSISASNRSLHLSVLPISSHHLHLINFPCSTINFGSESQPTHAQTPRQIPHPQCSN